MSLTADPGVVCLTPAWSHTFVEIDHEIISTVILLPSAESFKKDCCQLLAKVCRKKVLVNCLFKLAQEKSVVLMTMFSFYLSIYTGSLIHEHYTRKCEFGNFD